MGRAAEASVNAPEKQLFDNVLPLGDPNYAFVTLA